LTLDIDFAHLDFWGDFTLQYENAAIIHGTHKHCKTDPRYRLLIPLDREVNPDEYVAIARAVAGAINIKLFDQTTFETNRLMFWPSTPKDVGYYMEVQDGPWLCADEILDSYIDWTDTSLWPTSGQMLRELGANAKKQADPREKSGIVGAFCRTYSIIEVLEKFLADEYIATDHEDRYTYTQGSTAAGLIIYEDTFAYSHHGTDPCSGKTSNAFDLVRLHLYGHLDNEQQVQGAKPKSFSAMEEFARKDKAVKRTLAEESQANVRYDFAAMDDEDFADELDAVEGDSEDLSWMTDLEADTKGKYLSSAENITLIFKMDARLKECFKQNVFDNKRYVFRTLPWRGIKKPEPIKNVDYSGIRNYIETMYSIQGVQKIDDALALEFEKHSFHPIKDYLDGLKWDGEERLDYLLIDYFGANDNIYTREAMRKALVGAVARVKNPGVKFDMALVLIGPQGCYKSTFINKLGKSWYSDSFTTVHGKEAFEQLQGAWIMEIAEMAGFRKADNEAIKLYISKQVDTFRPAYGRCPEDFPRQNIFICTSNKRDLFTDPTGGRRFNPIDVVVESIAKDVWRDLDGEVDQIWAEAVALYKAGEKLYLSPEAQTIARFEQSSHSEVDERRGLIEFYLDRALPKDWAAQGTEERRMWLSNPDNFESKGVKRSRVCMAEIWCECLGKNKEDMTKYLTRDINDILKSFADWEYKPTTANFGAYGKQKYYSRKK
jgi:putative DNA primase/helicase